VWRGVSVAASLGPAGIKPTEAKSLPSSSFWRRSSSFAYLWARPGGGVTKQLPGVPAPSSFLFFIRLSGGRKRGESGVWRGVSVAASLGPAGIKPTEAKKPTVELVLAAEFLIRLPSGLSRRRRN
jgi:hypothetical protein